MYYKILNDKICCTKTDDGGIVQTAPWSADTPDNDALEWVQTDKNIVRLADYTFVFDDDPIILDSKKTVKLDALRASFDERVAGNFTTSQGYVMQFDTSDSLKMQGAIQLMEATEQTEGYLTQANDETVYHVPLATMKAVLVEMLSAYAECHAHNLELRTLINNAKTKEELDSIQITWPV